MKRLLLLVTVGGTLLSGCRISDLREITVSVPGMASETDVQRIRAALSPLAGLDKENTFFDIEGRVIRVRYDSMNIANKNIEITIAEAGYDANSIKAIRKDVPK